MDETQQIERILRRDGTTVRYDRTRIADAVFKATLAIGKPNPKLADSIASRAESILMKTYGKGGVPSVEDIQDIVENTLMESGHAQLARNYIIYRHHRAQLRAARAQPFEMSDIIPYKKIYEVLLWNIDHKCDTVAAINDLLAGGRFPALIEASEARFADEIRLTADRIAGRAGKARIVIIAGPSSSGKTTTTIKIREALARNGLGLKAINIDNYFFDLDRHPRDEFGDYDYETPQALDLKLINRHLVDLLEGKPVRTPHYDFKAGRRQLDVHELAVGSDELLLIDSLHGLYKDMTRDVPDDCKFRVYIETLGQLRAEDGSFMRWADNRLLRRMIRDRQHRNLRPLQTLTHWHYVRTSELAHIIPYINTADAVVNTALPYELPVLKGKLFHYFPKAMDTFKDDPKRHDAYIRAKRVYDFLKPLKKAPDSPAIPATSLLREFIGGSAYVY